MRVRVLLLPALVAAAARLVRRHAQVREVAADLRGPLLYADLSIPTVGAARRLGALPMRSEPPAGVPFARRRVAADGAEVDVHVHGSHVAGAGVVLWVHGGGHVLGRADMDHATCTWLARELGVAVVSVDYRVGPFPADLDDCATALRWVQGGGLGGDPGRVVVAGASAGGGLAASLAQLAADAGHPVDFQALVYPMLDDRTALRDPAGRGAFVWTPRSNRVSWQAYLGHRPGAPEGRAYAVPARRASLAGLPPAWIGVGALDLFHDEDLAYARRLRDAGVPCEVHVQPGMYHAADLFLPGAASTREFRGSLLRALRGALGPAAGGTSSPA